MPPNNRILRSDLESDKALEDAVQFRLTYEGSLLAATNNNNRASHKHEIRKQFHLQLKRLWGKSPRLGSSPEGPQPDEHGEIAAHIALEYPNAEEKGKKYDMFGYNFVPLIDESDHGAVGVDILMLRPDIVGGPIKSGDIDNRLKTLFDALRMPQNKDELGQYSKPDAEEKLFFCLVRDDRLIDRVSVETDALLQPTGNEWNKNDVRLVLTVKVRPTRGSWMGMQWM